MRTTLAELFDADGSSFIVHAGPDDHLEGPTTGPDRIACAVIEEQ